MVTQQVAQAGDRARNQLIAAPIDHAHGFIGVDVVQLDTALREWDSLTALTLSQRQLRNSDPDTPRRARIASSGGVSRDRSPESLDGM